MNNTNKDNKKITLFRLSLLDAKTHKQLFSLRFTRTGFFVTVVSIMVLMCAAIFSIIAFTPVKTFIPGYPDARTKNAAIRNAIKVDSLEKVIYRWELYSENLRRVVEGEQPVNIDSLISENHRKQELAKDPEYLKKQKAALVRRHRQVIYLNDSELAAINLYCERFRVDTKAVLYREAIMEKVLSELDDSNPTLF